jgi:hypothetical protein
MAERVARELSPVLGESQNVIEQQSCDSTRKNDARSRGIGVQIARLGCGHCRLPAFGLKRGQGCWSWRRLRGFGGNTRDRVRKVLRSGETSFEYERAVQPQPKLGRWTAELDDPVEAGSGVCDATL